MTPVSNGKKRGPGERLRPGAQCTIGTPSAWIFLVRLHACRAGGYAIQVQEVSRQDRERDSGCIPRSDMAQSDAAGVNGSNRILSHGTPQAWVMPNGCLGSPGFVLLWS